MNEIVEFKKTGALVGSDDLIKGLANVNSNLQGGSGGVPFLRLLKSGYYVYGQENIEIEVSSIWAINPYSMQHGYACWGDGELFGEQMVPFNQPLPPRSELPDYGEPWQQQVSMQLRCMNGEDEGVMVLYKSTSLGLRNSVKKLIAEIITQAQRDPNHVVPLVKLDVDTYSHKKYGEIFTPLIEIEEWVSISTGEAEEKEPEPEPEQPQPTETRSRKSSKPKGRQRRRAAPEPEPDENPSVEWVDGRPPSPAEKQEAREEVTPRQRRRRRRS